MWPDTSAVKTRQILFPLNFPCGPSLVTLPCLHHLSGVGAKPGLCCMSHCWQTNNPNTHVRKQAPYILLGSAGRVHTGHGWGHLSLLHATRGVGCRIQCLGKVGSWRCCYSGVSQLRLVVSRASCGPWLDCLHALSM